MQTAREVVESISGTSNRHSIVVETKSGGAVAATLQSAADDTVLAAMFDTIKDSAARQLSGTRGGMFFVGMHGINDDQLNSIAFQDRDPTQPVTALRMGVSKFLHSTGRDQVIGVGFLSEGGFTPIQDDQVSSGGTAYYFPKRESPFWSDDFSGLFTWNTPSFVGISG